MPTSKPTSKPASKPAGSKKKKKRQTRRRWMKPLLILLGILVVCIALLAKFYFVKAPKEAMIIVPKECTTQQLNDSIAKYMGDSYAGNVMTLVKLAPINVANRDGVYVVSEGTSALSLAWRIVRHRQSEIRLTINHVRTLDDLSKLISTKSVNSPAEVRKALTDTAFLNKYGVTAEQVRVLFMENTYNLHYGWSAAQVRDKVASEYEKFWNSSRKSKAEKLGLTPVQVMIIASIADEETAQADEKGAIGRLYINRLQKDMKLQADPTTKYAVGDFSIRRVTGRHTSSSNPYNTYKYAGLPPGPIRTTSAATVDAILDSEPSDYIFMCAKEDFSGYHNFAKTYEEHKKNADRYQAELNRRNIH